MRRRGFFAALLALLSGAAAALTAPANLTIHAPGPVWATVPTLTFTLGLARRITVTGFVTDAATIAVLSGTLPQGVTFDGTAFIYDGKGALGTGSGIVLTASDGGP